jgi:hypothetical protein
MAISKHMLRMVDENEKFTNNPKHVLAYVQVEACLWSFGSYYPVYFLRFLNFECNFQNFSYLLPNTGRHNIVLVY